MTSKQRAYLRSLANTIETIFQVGKGGVTPELIDAVDDALEKRELIKLTLLKNCPYDVRDVANVIAERTRSECCQVVGKKFVLYRPSRQNPKIVLPKAPRKTVEE